MKENKIGIIVCNVVGVITLILSIIFSVYELNWWSNFSFAIMGSALLSFAICLINYITIQKKLIEELVNGLYRFSNETNAQLYATRNNKNAENLATVIGIASSHLNSLTYYAYSIKVGLFKFEKKKRALLAEIVYELESNIHYQIYSIGQYLQFKPEDSEKNIDELYNLIDNTLKDELVYNKAFVLAKSVKSVIKSTEDVYGKSRADYKISMCDNIQAKIDKMKAK